MLTITFSGVPLAFCERWHVAQSFAVLALVPPDWDLWDDGSINGQDLKMGYWISMRSQALLSQKVQGRDLYTEADRHSMAADWVCTCKYRGRMQQEEGCSERLAVIAGLALLDSDTNRHCIQQQVDDGILPRPFRSPCLAWLSS